MGLVVPVYDEVSTIKIIILTGYSIHNNRSKVSTPLVSSLSNSVNRFQCYGLRLTFRYRGSQER